MAAVDYFLKIDGIPGESKDAKHPDEIQLESWQFGGQNGGTFAFGGGGGAGKVSMQDFHFTMKVNKATPRLFDAMNRGEHIKQAILTARKAGGMAGSSNANYQQDFCIWTFYDILVSSYQTGGSGSGDVLPIDQISLNFSKIQLEYKEQKADGSLAPGIKKGVDLKTQQAF